MVEKQETLVNASLIFGGFMAIVVVILLFSTAYTISAGERGVLLTFGKPSMDAVGEGLHFKFPIAQSIKKMDIRTLKIEVNADAASKDLQDVQTTVALNFHLSGEQVPKLYQEVGMAYTDVIINPAIQESVKSVQAKFTAEELVSRRTEVRSEIQDALSERLAKYYIVVDDFNIVNFQFSEEFDKAIEEKVTAEQRKLKAERDLERIIIEKEQRIAQAQAEAESLRLQKEQITPDLVKLRQIEVQREAIAAWDGHLPQVTGGAIPFIDMRATNYTN